MAKTKITEPQDALEGLVEDLENSYETCDHFNYVQTQTEPSDENSASINVDIGGTTFKLTLEKVRP